MMKKSFYFLLGLLIFISFTCYAQETRTTAAVVDLEVKGGVSPGVASMLSDYLRTQLVNTNKFTIVTRENMEQILKEQQFQMSGCTSQECIVQIGQLLGVRKMFTGSIGKVGDSFLINLKIINVQSGQIERAETERCDQCEEESLLVSIENIAYKIVSIPKPKQEKKEVRGKGIVKITTSPSGADVYINTDYKGKTPVIAEVKEGSNEIAIYRQGYISVVKSIELKAGEKKELEILLELQRATLFMQIEPAGAKLSIDGEDCGIVQGKTIQYSLIVGKHNIIVEKENYFTYQKEITVGYPKTELQITLNPRPGNLLVITTPEEAGVYVDGNYKGKAPLTIKDVAAGSHQVKATYEGYYDEKEVIIPPGGIKTVNLIIRIEKKEELTGLIEKKFHGRFGLGINWPGIQIRYGITNSLMAEGLFQFGVQNNSGGGRIYYLFDGFQGPVSVFPCIGGAYIWIFSPLLQGGYITGGFVGAEFLVTKNIGLGGDAGLYYANLWSSLGGYSDIGLIYNVGLTYYF